jgi:outer membrane protein
MAQEKIAVVNLQEAILQSDLAQQRLAEVRNEEDYKADKAEFDRLKEELDELVQEFQKDAAVMSQEQQVAARKKLASKQADLEHVTGKLQQAEQGAGQALLQELAPRWYRKCCARSFPVKALACCCSAAP